MNGRHAWDPTSYLANAATEHILSIDAEAAATSIVNYYEYIAAHLEQSEASQRIETLAAEQQQPMAATNGDRGVYVVRGVAMCVPFRVVVVLDGICSSVDGGGCDGGDDVRAAVFNALCLDIGGVFQEMREVFGHQPTSLLRRLDVEHIATVDNQHLKAVLRAALALQRVTGGTFTIQGRRLRDVVLLAIQRGDGTGGVPCDDTARADRFLGPWSAESPLHAAYAEAIEDLRSSVALTPCGADEDGGNISADTATTGDVKMDDGRVEEDPTDGRPLRLSKRAGMPLDVDAMSKGYVVDQLVALLQRRRDSRGATTTGCLVEWGGDVRVWGRPLDSKQGNGGGGGTSSSAAGPPPCAQRSEWIVGIRQPPKLDALYSSWRLQKKRLDGDGVNGVPDGATASRCVHFLPRDTPCHPLGASDDFRHGVWLCGTGFNCALATSGDYEQVQRFGYTHIVDPATGTLTRAHGHTLASVSVVAASAMRADGMATALLAGQRLDAALHAIRYHLRPLGLLRFYLYVRNHNQWIHDADDDPDEGAEAGDALRLLAHSQEEQLIAALQEVTHVDATAGGEATLQEHRSHEKMHRGGGGGGATWKTAAVQRVQNADACHHLVGGSGVGIGTTGSASVEQGPERLCRGGLSLRQTLKWLCKSWIPHSEALMVFASEVTQSLSSLGRTTTTTSDPAALMVVRLSSVVFLSTSPPHNGEVPSARRRVQHLLSFNVMRGTALHNAVVLAAGSAEGAPQLVLHFMRRDGCTIDLGSLPQWAKEQRRRVVPVVPLDDDNRADEPTPRSRATATFEALMGQSDVLLVTAVHATEVVGDHLVVLAAGTCIGAFDASRIATTAVLPDHRGVVASALHDEKVNRGVSGGGGACGGFPVAPVVVLASHRHHGLVGFPAFGLRMCSNDPLMLSVAFKRSCASELVLNSDNGHESSLLANPDLTIVLPRRGCTWFDGDAAAAADGDAVAAAASFCYVPTPIHCLSPLHRRASPSLEGLPDVAAALQCRLIATMVPPQAAPSSPPLSDSSDLLEVPHGTLIASVSSILIVSDASGAAVDAPPKGAPGCAVYDTSACGRRR